MLNPQAQSVLVYGVEYGIVWQNFSQFKRATIYLNNKRIGMRDLPVKVDEGIGTVQYLVKALIGYNLGGLK